MNNITRKQIKENLNKIEDILNTYEEWELDNDNMLFSYELTLIKNEIIVEIFEFDGDCESFLDEYKVEITDDMNMDIRNIVKSIVYTIYDEDINPRQHHINDTKNFNNRKIKSLALWSSRENTEKVNKINAEMVERYNKNEFYKYQITRYKEYVRDFYKTLYELIPMWKIEDTIEFIDSKISNCKFEYDGNCSCLTVKHKEKQATVSIDSYSKNKIILNEVRRQLGLIA